LNIYTRKQQWKLWLILMALSIVAAGLWFGNNVVEEIAEDEKNKVKLWAEAIVNKAALVKYTEVLFNKMKQEERKKVELWAAAYYKLLSDHSTGDLTFYIDIISSNKNIPTILTDKKDVVVSSINLDFELENNKEMPDSIKDDFSRYDPIIVQYKGKTLSHIYYNDSRLFTELQDVLNNLVQSFFSEVVLNSASVPVIITDENRKLIAHGNIDSSITQNPELLAARIKQMEAGNKPIEIELHEGSKNLIFYENSFLLTQIKYYPYIQFGIIGVFLFIAYLGFSNTRKAEQNQVWVGMAKETAHQLGTPLSSLIAWQEYLKSQNTDNAIFTEIEKDIKRLETITERFSKIGSEPKLQKENIVEVVLHSIEYIKARTSSKVLFTVNTEKEIVNLPLNVPLFEWVIENICRNAVDAMGGEGKIEITIVDMVRHIYIDISDTGKGMSKTQYKKIFKPGYTTKQRGWGLGLTLSKRIVENYHKGKIFVRQSSPSKGTTFRIVLGK